MLLRRVRRSSSCGRGAHLPRARDRERRSDGVALVRHRRGAACARRLAHLADLGLLEQRHVVADLRARPRGDRERSAELGHGRPLGVPGKRPARRARARPRRARATARPVGAQRGERAGRTAELGRKPLRAARQPLARAYDRDEPARRPSARRWSARPAAAACAPPSASAGASRRARRRRPPAPSSSSSDRARARAGRRASPRVSTMSWLVAPKWTIPGRLAADALAERAHERLGRVPDRARPASTIASTSKRSTRQASAIGPARCAGITPASASAFASARSASSIASSQARSETAARSGSRDEDRVEAS